VGGKTGGKINILNKKVICGSNNFKLSSQIGGNSKAIVVVVKLIISITAVIV
jgi:hypothetical protein